MKVTIIGGGGRVGSNAAFCLQCGGIVSEIQLLDANADLADGEALDMMPGLASDEEMRKLSLTDGIERGRLWLELMRAHHVGGVHMATAAIDLAGLEKVRRLARTQVDVQTYEIDQYDLLLAAEYA